MKAKLLKDTDAAPRADDPQVMTDANGKRYFPAGSIIDDPAAYRLVQMGVAEPADGECTLAAGLTTEQQKRAQLHQEMVAKGIHPDDYQKFIDGEMIGYDEGGNPISGPNSVEEESEYEAES